MHLQLVVQVRIFSISVDFKKNIILFFKLKNFSKFKFSFLSKILLLIPIKFAAQFNNRADQKNKQIADQKNNFADQKNKIC